MTSLTLPPSGSLIRLTREPIGSYAKAGEVYRVTYHPTRRLDRKTGKRVAVFHGQTSVHLWNESADCGTFDNATMWNIHGREAQWEVVAEQVAA
jgi:hypothetical protein